MADEETQDQQTPENEAIEGTEEEKSLEERIKEAIEVNVEDIGSLRKKLTVTVPREFIDERLDSQYDELRQEARAPRRLLEKRFGSEVAENLTQQLMASAYEAALEKTDLKVIGEPLVWAKEKGAKVETLLEADKAMELIEFPAEGPFEFVCEIEIRPEFELPELEGIEMSKPVVEVTDEQVNQQIERLRMMRGQYEAVPEGPIEEGDVVYADLKVICEDTVLREEENVRLAARPQHIESVVLEKLGEILAGAKVGDVRNATGELPDDYDKAELRGKAAAFEFKIRGIERMKLAEVNEEFAKGFGASSVDELQEWVKSDLESRHEQQVQRQLEEQARQYLLDKTDFELPERLSERQSERMMTRRMLDMYQQGMPQAEIENIMDNLRTSAREEAVRDLKLAFIMEKLADQFDVHVSEEEINARIAGIAQMQGQRFDRVRDELSKRGGLQNLYINIRDEKLMQQLIDKANITEQQLATEEKSSGAKKKTGKKKKGEQSDEKESE